MTAAVGFAGDSIEKKRRLRRTLCKEKSKLGEKSLPSFEGGNVLGPSSAPFAYLKLLLVDSA